MESLLCVISTHTGVTVEQQFHCFASLTDEDTEEKDGPMHCTHLYPGHSVHAWMDMCTCLLTSQMNREHSQRRVGVS